MGSQISACLARVCGSAAATDAPVGKADFNCADNSDNTNKSTSVRFDGIASISSLHGIVIPPLETESTSPHESPAAVVAPPPLIRPPTVVIAENEEGETLSLKCASALAPMAADKKHKFFPRAMSLGIGASTRSLSAFVSEPSRHPADHHQDSDDNDSLDFEIEEEDDDNDAPDSSVEVVEFDAADLRLPNPIP